MIGDTELVSEVTRIQGYVNPLAFVDVEEPWILARPRAVDDEDLRRYLCQPGLDNSLDGIVARYLEISIENGDRAHGSVR